MPTHNDFVIRPATLDHWEVKVRFSDEPGRTLATVTHIGYCDRRRDPLWHHTETVRVQGGEYALHDLVLHMALVLSQERPSTMAALHRHLVGEVEGQVPMF